MYEEYEENVEFIDQKEKKKSKGKNLLKTDVQMLSICRLMHSHPHQNHSLL